MGILISISTATRPIPLHPLRDLLAFFGIHRLPTTLRFAVRHRAATVAGGVLQSFQLRYRRYDSFPFELQHPNCRLKVHIDGARLIEFYYRSTPDGPVFASHVHSTSFSRSA